MEVVNGRVPAAGIKLVNESTKMGKYWPQSPFRQSRHQTARQKNQGDWGHVSPSSHPPEVAIFSCARVVCYQPLMQNINMPSMRANVTSTLY